MPKEIIYLTYMAYLYNQILYRPLLNGLILLYNTIAFHDLGLSILFLTIIIRLILFPIFHKSARNQSVMQRLQPHIKKIQETHKHDREKQTQAMMALYKEHGANPFSGILLLFVQLPILIALYQIILKSLHPGFPDGLYVFVAAPGSIHASFLGLIDLGGKSILIVGLAALAQYFQGKLSLPEIQGGQKLTEAEKVTRHMIFVGPAITLLIFYGLPAAISLYWLTTSLFSIFQQIIINKQITHGDAGRIRQKTNRMDGI